LLGVRAIPTDCDIRIGIATGEALVGSIGSEYMMSFTVMGDNVNLASRLEGANKIYGTHCLISEETANACGDAIELREIDRVVVIGQTHSEIVYEIMGRKGELTPTQMDSRSRYAEGLCAYRARRWDEAEAAFAAARTAAPDDGPALALMERIHGFKANPPAEHWDGAWHLERK
jgi:adenylate cyclase